MTPGGAFRVPPQYSGTDDNNFITRALSGTTQEQQITRVFNKILGS
jgi:capsid portal protein